MALPYPAPHLPPHPHPQIFSGAALLTNSAWVMAGIMWLTLTPALMVGWAGGGPEGGSSPLALLPPSPPAGRLAWPGSRAGVLLCHAVPCRGGTLPLSSRRARRCLLPALGVLVARVLEACLK